VSSLIQLAVGLLADLGLNKPPSIDDAPHIMLNYDARGCPKPFNPATRTMEERRAAITCFSFSSTYDHLLSFPSEDGANLNQDLILFSEARSSSLDAVLGRVPAHTS
jgi:hypothetical protein